MCCGGSRRKSRWDVSFSRLFEKGSRTSCWPSRQAAASKSIGHPLKIHETSRKIEENQGDLRHFLAFGGHLSFPGLFAKAGATAVRLAKSLKPKHIASTLSALTCAGHT